MESTKNLTESQKVELFRIAYPKGTRIKLYTMVGEQQMEFGLEGTVMFVDDAGQIHVNWDNGSTLALQDHDTYTVLN